MMFSFKKTFSILFVSFFYIQLFAQTSVRGIVKDAVTGEPVPFAIIKLVNSKKAFASTESGTFIFKPESTPAVIQVSSIGYSMEQTEVKSSDTLLNIKLKPVSVNLNEVNVYASRNSVQASSLETLKSNESYNLAGTTKDIFRSVQMLPGVSSNNAGTAQYNVRGGTYDENLMLINGIEVAEPYHIKIFPQASVGIFNIDLVQRVDFSGGGFSAEYGDALSSVLNIEYIKANNDSITGRINLGMIDLGLVTEIPAGKKTSLLIGARRSYLDPVIKMLDPGEKVSIQYYDIQSKFDYEINPRNKISVLAIYSNDNDKVGPQMNEYRGRWNGGTFNKQPLTVFEDERNHFLLDATYNDLLLALSSRHILSGRFIINSQFSLYRENENNPQTERDSTIYSYSVPQLFNRIYYYRDDIKDYSLVNYEYKLSGKIMFNQSNNTKSGIMIRRSHLDYNRTLATWRNYYNNTSSYPDTTSTMVTPTDAESNSSQSFKASAYKLGGYITHSWQPFSKLTVNLGVRADYFEINKELDFSPRTNAAYSILPGLKVTAAWGIYYESPLIKQLKYSYATKDNTKSQEATHYLMGIEKKNAGITVKLEAYYKKYDNLIPLHRTSIGEIIYDLKDTVAEGYATGADLEYIATGEHVDFWFNYSLGNAKERLKGTTHYYSRYTDQRHTVSSLLLFKLRNRNELGIKLTYGSGYAYQKQFYDNGLKQWTPGNEIVSDHLPYYMSLDLRYKKEFRIKTRPLQFYVDVMNVLNRKNAIGHRYGINNNGPYEEDVDFFGILPTFGIIFDF